VLDGRSRAGRDEDVQRLEQEIREADDSRGNLRWIVGTGCQPISERFHRVLRSTDQVPPGRDFNANRCAATDDLSGLDVLLVDDTGLLVGMLSLARQLWEPETPVGSGSLSSVGM
jgi:hypothetical protein